MNGTSYADRFRPAAAGRAMTYNFTLVLAASVFVAFCAQVAFYLPFAPAVPVTGQTFAVLLVGALLGRKLGALALVAYVAEGIAGLPVFAGGRAGLSVILGPTGGYILGFVAAAYLVGHLAERGWDRRLSTALAAMSLGTTVVFVFGCVWLTAFVGPAKTLGFGFYPFLPGAVLKIALAAALLPMGWRLIGKQDRRRPE